MMKGEGTVLDVNDGASNAFVTVDDVTDIDPAGPEAAAQERKRLSNTSHKEKYLGLPDPGELGFGFENGFDIHTRLAALFGVSKTWRITYSDGLRLAATGRLRAIKPDKIQGEVIVTSRAMVVLDSLYTVSDSSP